MTKKLTLKREYGLSPAGNALGGRWVARTPDGKYVDCGDHYNYMREWLEAQGFSVTKVGE